MLNSYFDDMNKLEIKDLCFAYLDAYLYAKQTEWLIHGKIQGVILNKEKETAVKCMEDYVEQLNLSETDKEEMKHNHKQWADLALKGVKERLRESGKIEE